jgi:hypothetical protein
VGWIAQKASLLHRAGTVPLQLKHWRSIIRADYLVLEGKDNASFLKQVFPTDLTQNVEIVGSSNWYAAFSLAGTIMSKRLRPSY